MIAPTSAGAKTNSGISGCPVERPSANASERPSILYLRESVRKGGAAGCGLVPVRPTAWQRAQFVVSNDSPRAASVVASSAKTGNIVIIVSKATREYGLACAWLTACTDYIANLVEQCIPDERL